MTWSAADHRFMSRAIELASRGRYSTHPNPRVGCVLVKNQQLVGEGWHERCGGPHAEIVALSNAGSAAKDATCYVSLEPCNHHGRTGPCTEALIDAGVSRVVAAMQDPNPEVAGQGMAKLESAGIQTSLGLMSTQSEQLNPGHIMRMSRGRPYIRCKMGISLDGRTAMANGESKWITGAAARADVQKLRAASSAVMTGIGTILADDPSLTVREIDTGGRDQCRIILDRKLGCPPDAKTLSLPGQTLIYTCNSDAGAHNSLQDAGAEIRCLKSGGFLDNVMRDLAVLECNEVLLEAGATLAGAMLQHNLVDEIILYQAPVLLGDSARGLFHLPGIKDMKNKIDLKLVDERMVGSDRRLTYRPDSSAE